MEKFPVPQAENLVGSTPVDIEDIKQKLGNLPSGLEGRVISDPKEILRVLHAEVGGSFREGELEKTDRDREIIALTSNAVKKFAGEYGRKEFVNLPVENIHFFPEGTLAKIGNFETGSAGTLLGEIFVEKRSELETAITMFHEMWHILGSYSAVQVTTDGRLQWYRTGFSVNSRDDSKSYFYYLDEALTGIITKRFVDEVLAKLPDFTESIEKRRTDGTLDTTREREATDFLISVDRLYKENKDIFFSAEEVLKKFLMAQVDGNISPLGRFIDKRYGSGTFRNIGENF